MTELNHQRRQSRNNSFFPHDKGQEHAAIYRRGVLFESPAGWFDRHLHKQAAALPQHASVSISTAKS